MSVTRAGTSQVWTSVTAEAVGSITITSVTGNRVVGTFSATLAPGAGTTGQLVITNGTFDVRVDTP